MISVAISIDALLLHKFRFVEQLLCILFSILYHTHIHKVKKGAWFSHGNQFSWITLRIISESSKHWNIMWEMACLELVRDLNCLTRLIVAFLNHIQTLLCLFIFYSARILLKMNIKGLLIHNDLSRFFLAVQCICNHNFWNCQYPQIFRA